LANKIVVVVVFIKTLSSVLSFIHTERHVISAVNICS